MKTKEFTKILRRHYAEPTVKVLRTGKMRPSYKKMILLENDGIPFEAWKNIRAWLSEQEAKQAEQKKDKK